MKHVIYAPIMITCIKHYALDIRDLMEFLQPESVLSLLAFYG